MNRDWEKHRRADKVAASGAHDRRTDADPKREFISGADVEALLRENLLFAKSMGPVNARMKRAIARFRRLTGAKYSDLSDDTIYRLANKYAAEYEKQKFGNKK